MQDAPNNCGVDHAVHWSATVRRMNDNLNAVFFIRSAGGIYDRSLHGSDRAKHQRIKRECQWCFNLERSAFDRTKQGCTGVMDKSMWNVSHPKSTKQVISATGNNFTIFWFYIKIEKRTWNLENRKKNRRDRKNGNLHARGRFFFKPFPFCWHGVPKRTCFQHCLSGRDTSTRPTRNHAGLDPVDAHGPCQNQSGEHALPPSKPVLGRSLQLQFRPWILTLRRTPAALYRTNLATRGPFMSISEKCLQPHLQRGPPHAPTATQLTARRVVDRTHADSGSLRRTTTLRKLPHPFSYQQVIFSLWH